MRNGKTVLNFFAKPFQLSICICLAYPIFNQCSTTVPPENIRKPFRGYRIGTLVENGLNTGDHIPATYPSQHIKKE